MSTIAIGSTGAFGPSAPVRPSRPATTGVRRAVTQPRRSPSAGPARVQGMRLTRRGRAVVTLVALAIAVGGVLSAQRAEAGSPGGAVAVTTHTVTSGDTLWSVARTIALPGEDVRDVVDELIRINGLPDASLRIGQQLIVPEP